MKTQVILDHRPPAALVIAHRGARGHAPENTLEAAALGYAVGADLWELDVNYSSDGQLIVMHDDTLVRTTNVQHLFPSRPSYRVCDFTLDELKTLDAGSWYAERDPFGRIAAGDVTEPCTGLRVPTLEEALKLTQKLDWAVNVEIKDHAHLIGHTTVTEAVVTLIHRLDMVERVILSSFQHQYLRESRVLLPALPTGALVETVRPSEPVALCRELGVVAYHPDRLILTPGDIAALREAEIAVNVWTVNDMDEARRLINEGATGIITDFPAACLSMLGRNC